MKFISKTGPHIKSKDNTKKIMTRLLIALTPIICFGLFKNIILVYYYTNTKILELLNPLFMILAGIITSYISEYLYTRFIQKKDKKLPFISYAIMPGLLLSLILPVNTPIWIVVFGAFCATIIGKMIFGGLGQNIFNPALVGYLLISVSYSSKLGNILNNYELDTIGGATPLSNLANLGYIGGYDSIVGTYGNLFNFMSGTIPGMIGEVSKILIIIAFIYLALTKTIKWRIPLMYISTVFIITMIIGYSFDLGVWYPLFHILSGGLLFGAVFMATDPVTSPITTKGQIFYGICLGLLTVSLRFLTSYPEGVMTSILFMNLLVFMFDKIGVKMMYNKKIKFILIFAMLVIFAGVYFAITNRIANGNESNNNTEVINTKEEDTTKVYTVTAKGWSLLEADVTVENNQIVSIDVTDYSGETKWDKIESADYINQLIVNQEYIDNLDAVSGATYTSTGLKNIVKQVLEEVNGNEE
ncbi:MAG TPA: RnfABCDGE type electron transport complex subunit D [Bacilli bacterium]|mgnify:CR=1 FL=1|nr:RnfABCDGE type electron transport complex subunit D [Bacilli bacterium]